MKGTKVAFDRPSKVKYLKEIVMCIITFRFFKDLFDLSAYYIVNHTIGLQKAKVGKASKIHATTVLRQGERIEIGSYCLVNHNNVFQAGKKFGRIVLGDYVHTGANVMIFAFNHSIDDIEIPSVLQDYYDADVVIEDDVWIGAGSIILAGVHIGRGSVIAAGSVVNKNIPAMSIAGGVPAKVLKQRS